MSRSWYMDKTKKRGMYYPKPLNVDFFKLKSNFIFFFNIASQFIQNLPNVSWPLREFNTSALLRADNRDYVRGHQQFTHRWAPWQHCATMSDTCIWWEIQAAAACSTYLIKQRLPLLRRGKREKKSKWWSEREEEVVREKQKPQKQVPQQWRGAPVWKWWILAKRTFLPVSILLNCSLAITCCYYLIIVVNELRQKIIRYQSVDHYLWEISYVAWDI